MRKINETDSLNELIIAQEQQFELELILLKDQLHLAYESIKPINLIKSLVHEVSNSPEIKTDMLDNLIGMGTGYISKKLLIDTTHNPIKKGIGYLLQFAIGNAVSKHAETIKIVGANIINYITKKENL